MKQLAALTIAGLILFACPCVLAGDKEQEITAIENAVVTISQAVEKLENRYRAVAVEAEVESWRNTVVYEVELIDGEKMLKVEINLDMKSGEVLKESITSIASWFGGDDDRRLAVDAATKNRFGICKAIAIAKKYVTGYIYDAELEREEGVTFVKIEFYTPTGKEKIIVNVETQSIIPVLKRP